MRKYKIPIWTFQWCSKFQTTETAHATSDSTIGVREWFEESNAPDYTQSKQVNGELELISNPGKPCHINHKVWAFCTLKSPESCDMSHVIWVMWYGVMWYGVMFEPEDDSDISSYLSKGIMRSSMSGYRIDLLCVTIWQELTARSSYSWLDEHKLTRLSLYISIRRHAPWI